MAATTDSAPVSDAEGEKPVREQLKKASIAAQGGRTGTGMMLEEHVQQEQDVGTAKKKDIEELAPGGRVVESANAAQVIQPAQGATNENHDEGGRVQRKRSFEEAGGEDADQPSTFDASRQHTRKRSRDSTAEEAELNNARRVSGERPRDELKPLPTDAQSNGDKATTHKRVATPEEPSDDSPEAAAAEAIASPKTKRSRLLSSTTTITATEPNNPVPAPSEPTKIPPTSGFANTSTASPFSTLASPIPPASGFGALGSKPSTSIFGASSTTSGFGKLGASAGGGFGSSAFGSSNGSGSAFGSALGGGGLGGNFASGKPTASFASGSTVLGSTSKAPKPFGASAENNDEEGDDTNDGEEGDNDDATGAQQQDERFHEQLRNETGEEDEETVYSCRAKLYNYSLLPDGKKEWRERGLGVLRLNVKRGAGEEGAAGEKSEPKARFLMRADGSHRVVLNSPVKKEIHFGAVGGGKPVGGLMLFMGTTAAGGAGAGEGGGLEMLQLKMRQQFALELWEKIRELQGEM